MPVIWGAIMLIMWKWEVTLHMQWNYIFIAVDHMYHVPCDVNSSLISEAAINQ